MSDASATGTGERAPSVALRGRVVTDYEVWNGGTVLFGGGAIAGVSPDDSLLADADEVHDHGDALLLPGFVDLQVNGAFGVDAASRPSRLAELSAALLSTGTTSYLPTVISSPEGLYEEVLPVLASEVGGASGAGAEPLGVHLEGHFVNPEKRGAHAAAHVAAPDQQLLGHLLDLGPVRKITLAPEISGAGELSRLRRTAGWWSPPATRTPPSSSPTGPSTRRSPASRTSSTR